MAAFFTQKKDDKIERVLLFSIQDNKIVVITRSLLEFLKFDISAPAPQDVLQILEPTSWEGLQTHPIGSIPHTGSLTLLNALKERIIFTTIHYAYSRTHHLFLLAPQNPTLDQRTDLQKLFDFVNHETRTPINALLGLIDLLSQTPLTDEQRQYIDAMHGLAESLINLLSDAIDSSRISAGKMTLRQNFFDLYAIASKIITRNKLLHPHLQLNFSYQDDLAHQIYGDAHRIEQVLINIISNALKHTTAGSVSLNISKSNKQANYLEINIIDTGSGITPEVQKRLFNPYERSEDNMTMGSGLGLYITKQIVELHQGDITLTSQFGKGTTVTITLPLIEKTTIPTTIAAPENKTTYAVYNGKRLLLVDDNAINIMVVQKFLKRWGYIADTANSGRQALEALEKGDYGLILMDLRMPEMDGFQATQQIRSRKDKKASTPIIALTASTEQGIRERIQETNMNGYLFKPFNAEELHQLVAKYLGWCDNAQNNA